MDTQCTQFVVRRKVRLSFCNSRLLRSPKVCAVNSDPWLNQAAHFAPRTQCGSVNKQNKCMGGQTTVTLKYVS